MATNLTKMRVDEFIEALKAAGGSSGNKSLRQALKWDEAFYWKVQGRLIEQGQILSGRGKGGSVRFTESQAAKSGAERSQPVAGSEMPALSAKEKELYPLLSASIEGKWIKRFALDDVLVDETHSRGSKNTGGTFSRPDITAAGIRTYVYLPKRLEILTFEVKSMDTVTILGVLEAIAHREAAHRAYVLYGASRATFEAGSEGDRIIELAQKHGIGVVLTEKPDDVESWEILLDAIRHEPDPARLDRFLNDLPSDRMKKQLSKWRG